jgi:quercetin dioxygenase-like cupin family protein
MPSVGRQKPRVLFSSPECRLVVIDLQGGEELGDHQVRERAVLEVIAGRVSIECSPETVECEAGTLATFDPGEPHSVRALTDARLLLVLAPWLAARNGTEPDVVQAQHLPANALAEPIESLTGKSRPA